MFQHDVRHTGRSPFGNSGNWFVEKWKYDFIESMMFSSPAIDKNGTIYIGSFDWYFYAINSDGTMKWRYKTGEGIKSSPAIGEDGTIYVGSDDGKLYAIYPDGTKKWSLTIGGSWVNSAPVIDEYGIIYVTSVAGNNICAVYPNGTKKWDFKTSSDVYSSPVLDNMGTVYCGSHDGYMYAIYTSNGTLKWRHGTGTYCGGVGATVGDDGTIYFGDLLGYLHAVNPNGTQKWKRDVGDNIYSSPTITEEGNIIIGCYDGYIYSFNPDNGAENWRFKVEEWVYISGSPSIDKYGIIYVGAWNGWFYALNPDGTLKWKYKTLDEIFTSAAIGEDGTIYFGAHSVEYDAYLYAIKPIEDNAPEIPFIDGPISGKPRSKYTYTAVTNDSDGDDVSYFFDWGDGTFSGWTGYVSSGTSVSLGHRWLFRGNYTIKVKAKDVYGLQGDWGTFIVTMPRDKAISSSLFLWFLERFPLLNRLLSLIRV
jgi:outer membrane protein assembly factor BamB